jgi:hypothetical protein
MEWRDRTEFRMRVARVWMMVSIRGAYTTAERRTRSPCEGLTAEGVVVFGMDRGATSNLEAPHPALNGK